MKKIALLAVFVLALAAVRSDSSVGGLPPVGISMNQTAQPIPTPRPRPTPFPRPQSQS